MAPAAPPPFAIYHLSSFNSNVGALAAAQREAEAIRRRQEGEMLAAAAARRREDEERHAAHRAEVVARPAPRRPADVGMS